MAPPHPATVHYPIGLFTLSFALDTLQVFPHLARGLTWLKVMPPAAVVNTISHYAGAAGLLIAGPTVLTGVWELYLMWSGQIKEKKTIKATLTDAIEKKDVAGEKLKVALTHATLNDIVMGVAAYNWWVRRVDRDLNLPLFNATLSALTLPLFLYSAHLGGMLVYKYGTGVMRGKEGREIKKKENKE
ncbi:hypothetical protein JCM21900_002680 [Sporobolomyces salmonicolor]